MIDVLDKMFICMFKLYIFWLKFESPPFLKRHLYNENNVYRPNILIISYLLLLNSI